MIRVGELEFPAGIVDPRPLVHPAVSRAWHGRVRDHWHTQRGTLILRKRAPSIQPVPVGAQDHYYIPPLERVDSNRVLNLIHTQNYLVLRAPRQTGKTSALIALQDHLNSGAAGNYRCLYVTIEGA